MVVRSDGGGGNRQLTTMRWLPPESGTQLVQLFWKGDAESSSTVSVTKTSLSAGWSDRSEVISGNPRGFYIGHQIHYTYARSAIVTGWSYRLSTRT